MNRNLKLDNGRNSFLAQVVVPTIDVSGDIEFFKEKFGFKLQTICSVIFSSVLPAPPDRIHRTALRLLARISAVEHHWAYRAEHMPEVLLPALDWR